MCIPLTAQRTCTAQGVQPCGLNTVSNLIFFSPERFVRWLECRRALKCLVFHFHCSDWQEEISEVGWDEHPGYVPSCRQGLRLNEDRRTQHTLQQVIAYASLTLCVYFGTTWFDSYPLGLYVLGTFLENPTLPVCFLPLYPLFSSQPACVMSASVWVCISFSVASCPVVILGFSYFSSFRMVGDEDDEGALSDSDGQGGLAADDLASK